MLRIFENLFQSVYWSVMRKCRVGVLSRCLFSVDTVLDTEI